MLAGAIGGGVALLAVIVLGVYALARPGKKSRAPFEPGPVAKNVAPAAKENRANIDRKVAEEPKESSGPLTKPTPPLMLAVPAALAEQFDGKNMKKMEDAELFVRASQAMAKQDYGRAAAYQYWLVHKTKSGQYNLACFLARTGKVDPAFYWLQRAALEEGVDTEHAQRDEDLESLRGDPRWEQVHRFLESCNRYFETAPLGRTVVLLPRGYKKGTPIPAILWLHGLGSRPEGFVNADAQDLVDELKVALIGVSGTRARGPRSYVWAEDVDKDARRLRDAVAEVSDRVSIKKGHVITFGFSQGAQMGLEIAAKYPEEYAGAIALSPGAVPHLDDLKPSPLLKQRGFVVSCGADEHPGNVRLTALDADWLRRAGAKVIHKEYPGVSAHSFPRDFVKRFPEWVQFIRKTRGE